MSNKHIIEKLIDEQEQLEEQIKQLKLELLMTKEESETYEKQNNEWFKICGCDGLIQDLFYDGYHTTKLIDGEVDEVYKAITEMKNKIDELKEENEKLNKLMIYEHTSCYDGRMMLVKTLWEKEEDWRDRIDLDFSYINEKIIKLKEENEKIGLMLDEERNEKDRNERL